MEKEDLQLEEELVRKAQHSRQAFGELYRRYYAGIFGYTLNRVADVQLALDITSATFFKALNRIQRFRWRDIPFSAWLYRIATNEINDYYRKKKHPLISLESNPHCMEIANPSDEITEAEEEMSRREEFLRLHKTLTGLPLKYQEVISLRFFEKKSIKDISQILGKKEGTVKSLLHRGLEQLRAHME